MLKHFTATAYIISKIDGEYKVLLHKHKKMGIWIGIGGHVEKDENPVETLLREVKEETNLHIKLISEEKLLKTGDVEELITPQTIIEEKIPPYQVEPAHFHIDNIYFAFCKNSQKIKMDEEYAWFSWQQLKFGLEKEVEVFAKKAIDKVAHSMVF